MCDTERAFVRYSTSQKRQLLTASRAAASAPDSRDDFPQSLHVVSHLQGLNEYAWRYNQPVSATSHARSSRHFFFALRGLDLFDFSGVGVCLQVTRSRRARAPVSPCPLRFCRTMAWPFHRNPRLAIHEHGDKRPPRGEHSLRSVHAIRGWVARFPNRRRNCRQGRPGDRRHRQQYL
jgi:hypothetical protein